MSPKDESAFMTNREMIREMYIRTKNTEDMVSNMKGDVSVLTTIQNQHTKEINGLQNWRNITITGTIGALFTGIVSLFNLK